MDKIQEVAAMLQGMQYGHEIKPEAEELAKQHGLVILKGGSDDLAVFSGAIDDEVGADTGTKILFVDGKLLTNDERFDDQEEKLEFIKEFAPDVEVNEIKVTDKSGRKKVKFAYKTEIPHATFNVLEDEDLYCVGIVFSVADMGIKKVVQEAIAELEKPTPLLLEGSVMVQNPESSEPGDADRAHVVYADGKQKMFLVAFGFNEENRIAEWNPNPAYAMDFGSFTMASRATMLLNAMNMSPEEEAKIFAEPAA